jgi:hypothetical protein
MRDYAVATTHTDGVGMRHVGPRGATWAPLPISTRSMSNLLLGYVFALPGTRRGHTAWATFSCQVVPCRSIAHMTRTR